MAKKEKGAGKASSGEGKKGPATASQTAAAASSPGPAASTASSHAASHGVSAQQLLRPFALKHTAVSMDKARPERLHLNNAYFDALLTLVPAHIYFGKADGEIEGEEENPSRRYFVTVKGEHEKAAVKFREDKGKKRIRFDGE